MKRILYVEDDTIISSGLIYTLGQEGYTVVHSKSVSEAVHILQNETFDLALLDMQLPDGTGFDIREKLIGTGTAVIFLTVVDDEDDILRAFEDGADDYITKPFRLRELLARVKRSLHTQGGADRPALLTIGSLSIDTAAGKVYMEETLIDLTALEYRLLLTFASNKGQLLTRTQILENIWDAAGNYVEDNTLTVYVKRLREKLHDAIDIETVRGIGYRVN